MRKKSSKEEPTREKPVHVTIGMNKRQGRIAFWSCVVLIGGPAVYVMIAYTS